MLLTTPQFLDLVHHYRLQLTPADEVEDMNKLLSGPRITSDDEKPQMMTEAAKAIAVPHWWRGNTTVSEAQLAADRMQEARR